MDQAQEENYRKLMINYKILEGKLKDRNDKLQEIKTRLCQVRDYVEDDGSHDELCNIIQDIQTYEEDFANVMSVSSIDCRTCDNYSKYSYDIETVCDICRNNPSMDSYYVQSKK